MTVQIPVLSANSTTTFQQWFDRTNLLSNTMSLYVVTANNNANGSLTTGNCYINGVFSSLIGGFGQLRGGNVQTSAVLPITSNVSIGNATSNVVITYGSGGGGLTVGSVVVNTSSVLFGANVLINTTNIRIGNSTVNSVFTSTTLTLPVGGSISVNSVPVALSNSSVVVANNGTTIGTRGKINFIQGNNVTLGISTDAGGGQVNVIINATGGTTNLTGEVTSNSGVATISNNVVSHTKMTNGARVSYIPFIIDGGTTTIATGEQGFIPIPKNATITEWTLLADQSGSIVIDIWKDTYANYPPVNADSITGSAKPTITSSTKARSSTLTGWTTSITADDILGFEVESVTNLRRVTVYLKVLWND